MIAYLNLPSAQRKTQRIVDQFNAAEEVWRSLETKRLALRERYSKMSPELRMQLDLLEFTNARTPQDCIGFVDQPE